MKIAIQCSLFAKVFAKFVNIGFKVFLKDYSEINDVGKRHDNPQDSGRGDLKPCLLDER